MDRQKIINWLVAQINQTNKSEFLINLINFNEVNKELVLLCKQTQFKTKTIVSPENTEAIDFCKANHIIFINFDSKAHSHLYPVYDERVIKNLEGVYCKALCYDKLMVGEFTKTDLNIIRNYPDFTYHTLLPFGNLNLSNLIENQDKPYFDEFTVREIEWAQNINIQKNIISSNIDPAKYPAWFSFTSRQKYIISKLFNIEKETRYKNNTNFICPQPQ